MMYSTFHLSSAQELNADILKAIKAAFKSNPIRIIVEVDTTAAADWLSDDTKAILDERLTENDDDYIWAADSINQLNQKYGL